MGQYKIPCPFSGYFLGQLLIARPTAWNYSTKLKVSRVWFRIHRCIYPSHWYLKYRLFYFKIFPSKPNTKFNKFSGLFSTRCPTWKSQKFLIMYSGESWVSTNLAPFPKFLTENGFFRKFPMVICFPTNSRNPLTTRRFLYQRDCNYGLACCKLWFALILN